jgi:hypothetical protein
VRKYVQSWLSGKVKGKIYIGRISGGFLSGVTIDSCRHSRHGGLDLHRERARARQIRLCATCFDRRILLSHVSAEHPYVHIREHENGTWNWRLIFPDGPAGPKNGRGFGDFIVMDSADIHDGTVVVTLPWHPSDTLRGYKRDSAIVHALGSLTRDRPGN